MNKHQTELIFVYNANSSLFSQVTDYVHKILSPQYYPCNLCKLTYGNLGIKKEWKAFIAKLPIKSAFLHKDEFVKQFPNFVEVSLPAIFKIKDKQLTLLITAEDINKQQTIHELETLLNAKL